MSKPYRPHPFDDHSPVVVSDAARGGQVLLCSETFADIKDQLVELGHSDNDPEVTVSARSASLGVAAWSVMGGGGSVASRSFLG